MQKLNRQFLGHLEAISSGYRNAQVLFTANRLKIFDALQSRAKSTEEVAQQLKTNPRATRMLLDALVSIGLLKKQRTAYANTPLARECLVAGSPCDQQALLEHGAELYERWGQLAQSVKTGRPAPRKVGGAKGRRDEQAFAHAMAAAATGTARETAAHLGLQNVRRMLDIGGGPGAYAIECARLNPALKVVIFDTPKTLEVARKNIARAGLAKQISVMAGDAFGDDFGKGYDLILLSNIVHVYSSAMNERLIQRAGDCLESSGRLCIKDFILDASRTRPENVSLFAINMLVNTDGGDCYTVSEIQSWLKKAGLKTGKTISLSPPSKVIVGRKE